MGKLLQDYVNGAYEGFMAGVRIAEHLNNIDLNATFSDERAFNKLLDEIMSRNITLLESASELPLPPGTEDREGHRKAGEESIRKVAWIIICKQKENWGQKDATN